MIWCRAGDTSLSECGSLFYGYLYASIGLDKLTLDDQLILLEILYEYAKDFDPLFIQR